MQALHYLGNALGPAQLRWQDVPDAALVNPGDALVRPLAVAACDLDRSIVDGNAPFKPPFVLGHEFTGEVIARGEQVTAIDVGDIVLASFQPSCGACEPCKRGHTAACAAVAPTSMYGIGEAAGVWSGAFADAVRVPWADFNLRRLPANVTPIDARLRLPNVSAPIVCRWTIGHGDSRHTTSRWIAPSAPKALRRYFAPPRRSACAPAHRSTSGRIRRCRLATCT